MALRLENAKSCAFRLLQFYLSHVLVTLLANIVLALLELVRKYLLGNSQVSWVNLVLVRYRICPNYLSMVDAERLGGKLSVGQHAWQIIQLIRFAYYSVL